MPDLLILTFIGAVVLALVHIAAPWLRPRLGASGARWHSFAGGMGVGYVFVLVLPELAAHQAAMSENDHLAAHEREIFLTALAGLSAYYWLEAATGRAGDALHLRRMTLQQPGYWIHLAGFGFYSSIVGYIMGQREEEGTVGVLAYTLALAVHFFVNDRDIMSRAPDLHRHLGRWLLAASVMAGWGVGATTPEVGRATALIFAFLTGGMILNILKQELPSENQSRFGAFLAGVLLYAGLGALTGS